MASHPLEQGAVDVFGLEFGLLVTVGIAAVHQSALVQQN